jgi:hypothetical protein
MLASLATHTPPSHLITVLNTRQDWRRAAVRPLLECLMDNGWESTLVEVGKEVGYVRACNLGWSVCQAEGDDILVVLNDDLEFKGKWLGQMQAVLADGKKSHPGVHQVGPSVKAVGPEGTWGTEGTDPPFVEGWCFAMRAGTVQALRVVDWSRPGQFIFDPQFEPQFCEDMDLSLRIKTGIAQVEIPVGHIRSATVGTGAAREPYFSENRRKLCEKWNLGGAVAVPCPGEPATKPPIRPPPSGLEQAVRANNWELVP